MDAIRNISRTFVPVMACGLVMLAGGASISSPVPLVIVPVHQQHQQPAALALVNGPARLPQSMRRACRQEDSINCWWNDGGGHPFVVRQFPGSAHLTCWMFEAKGYAARHDYCISEAGSAPSSITCANIVVRAGSEFPVLAGKVAGICLVNHYQRGSRWTYVGRYDRHVNVWRMTGPTSVFFNGSWFETS